MPSVLNGIEMWPSASSAIAPPLPPIDGISWLITSAAARFSGTRIWVTFMQISCAATVRM